jgi:sugar lactone lactonase YvrE
MKRKGQKLMKAFPVLLLLITGLGTNVFSQQGIITTFAGGGPNSAVALSADITPVSVEADTRGNLFIAGYAMHQVFKVDPAGNFTVVAGTGIDALSGDGGPASQASLAYPSGVAVDTQGDIFIADTGNCVIRRVDAVTGIITTVAGNSQFGFGAPGFSGDGGPATSALLNFPIAVALDTQGNLFIADTNNNRIRRVDALTGIITTVAGNGALGSSGDHGLATKASLNGPGGMVVDAQGNLFFVDAFAIRRVDAVTGIITTFAGNHIAGYSGDGGLAISASLFVGTFDGLPGGGVAFDAHGNLLIADSGNQRIRRVDAVTGVITTVAGSAQPNAAGYIAQGYSGDGGAATNASLAWPACVAVDADGNFFIADFYSQHIRRVDALTGIITTVAGGGGGGDAGPATSALLVYPTAVAADSSGNVFIADWSNNRIRRVDATTGIITTAAGNGIAGYSGDGGPATSASLWGRVGDVAVDAHGNLFIADINNERIRRVDAVTGIISTVAGSGQPGTAYIPGGYSGDGGPATSATLEIPNGIALDTQGNLFIADTYNERIRRVDAVTGIITTVAGDGQEAFSGDGGPATSASLDIARFGDVALDARGNLFIADTGNNRVRRVDAVTGIITRVAGGGPLAPPIGDGGPATSASLTPGLGTVDAEGRLLIADPLHNRVRVVPLPPFVALSATALPFSTQLLGTTSAAQTLTLTNTGMVALNISSLAIAFANASDYGETNTCGSSLGPGVNCTISVTFTPAATGSRTATLTITDDASGSPHTVLLSGTGLSGDFSVTASPTSATVTRGQTATYNLSITPLGNPSGPVTFTCSGAPAEATCTVNPSPVNLSGSGAASATVSVSTTAPSAVGMRPKPPAGPWIWLWMLGLLAAVGTRLMGGRRLAWRRAWAPLAVAMLSLTLWAGCGGGAPSNPGTPAGTYNLTVTGTYTSGTTTVQHNVTLTVRVN